MNLVRTSDLLLERLGAITRQFGLSTTQSNVLGILEGAGQPLPPHVIGQRLFASPTTVTGLLDALERRGLVRRTRHPTDRRKLLIELTEKGRDVFARIRPLIHRGEIEWLSALTLDEQEALVQLLGKVQAHLHALSEAGDLDSPEVEVT